MYSAITIHLPYGIIGLEQLIVGMKRNMGILRNKNSFLEIGFNDYSDNVIFNLSRNNYNYRCESDLCKIK
jgi:hypothetical protein